LTLSDLAATPERKGRAEDGEGRPMASAEDGPIASAEDGEDRPMPKADRKGRSHEGLTESGKKTIFVF